MTVLRSHVDTTSETYISNYKGNLELIAEHDEWLAKAREGGDERYNARRRSRGKLLPRERIELLLDRDSPFLELTPLAAWGTDFTVGGSRITGIGVVSGVGCACGGAASRACGARGPRRPAPRRGPAAPRRPGCRSLAAPRGFRVWRWC